MGKFWNSKAERVQNALSGDKQVILVRILNVRMLIRNANGEINAYEISEENKASIEN